MAEAGGDTAADATLARIADEVAGQFRRYPEEVAPMILRQVPALGATNAMTEMFGTMVREHTEAILHLLHTPVPRDSITPAGYTAPFARACARLGVPAAAVLRGYQHGHEYLWHWWSGQISRRVTGAEARAATTARLAELLMAYASDSMALTVEVHAAETTQHTLGASWRRRTAVLEIVENRTRLTEAELSSLLGYDLQRWHVGFLAWSAADDTDAWSSLDTLVHQWATHATGQRPLLIGVDDRTVWGWVGGLCAPSWTDYPAPDPQLRVAVGHPGHGLDGFRLSHREATLARSLAATVPDTVLRYGDLATVALLREDHQLQGRYVEFALGGLAAPGSRPQTLRDTVRTYLREGENLRAAARTLHLHRNTLQQRLHHAAALRGRPLSEDRLALAMALEIFALGATRPGGWDAAELLEPLTRRRGRDKPTLRRTL